MSLFYAIVTLVFLFCVSLSGQNLSRSGWTAHATTETTGFEASKSLDGNSTTFWSPSGTYAQFFWVDMGSAQTINYIKWLPRQDGTPDNPGFVQVDFSSDGSTWTSDSAVGGGGVSEVNWAGDATEKIVTFPTQTFRWFRLRLQTAAAGARSWPSCAEVNAGFDASKVASQRLSFLSEDDITSGNWVGVYGRDGYNIVSDTSSYPSYATTVTVAGQTTANYGSTDSRFLQKASNHSLRSAGSWFTNPNLTTNFASFTIDITVTQPTVYSMYFLDGDSNGRNALIYAMDTQPDGSYWVRDVQRLTTYGTTPRYMRYRMPTGTTRFRVQYGSGATNESVEGIFFDPFTGSNQGGAFLVGP